MATQKFSNNASALLAGSIGTDDLAVQVAAAAGALFPSVGGSEFFLIAVENSSGAIEIMRCTARSGDVLTVVRAQEGTSALGFTASQARVEVRLTRDTMTRFIQHESNVVETSYNFSGGLQRAGSTVLTEAQEGSGNGIDADTVDGQHAAAFAAASHAHSAADLTSGTVPDARFPATLPAISGANLTNLDASDLATGSIPDARVPASAVSQHQAALTTRNVSGKTGITKTLSTSAPSGGADGDIWFRY